MKKKLLLPLAMAALLGLSACVQISFTPPGKSSSEPGKSSDPTSSVTPVEEGSVTEVTVSLKNEGDTATIVEGETLDLVANVVGEGTFDKTVTWSSSDSEIAAVNRATGRVTAKTPGTATITATSTQDSTKFGSIEVTVTARAATRIADIGLEEVTVKGVVVAKNTKSFIISDGTAGIMVYLNAEPSDYNIGDYVKVAGTPVESKYANGLLQFDSKAVVEKLTDGTMPNIPAAVDLTAAKLAAWKAALPTESSAQEHKFLELTEVVEYQWVGTAGNSGGYLTLNMEGSDVVIEPAYLNTTTFPTVEGHKYDVKAYFVGYNYHGYAAVVVTSLTEKQAEVGDVIIEAASREVTVGDQLTLTATVAGVDNPTITWSSSDPSIATVADGVVLGVAPGKVTITAEYDADHKATIEITVKSASVAKNLAALELNDVVTLDVKVIGEAYNGFVVGDATGVAYIYTRNYNGDNKTPAVGTHLTIAGDVGAYNGGLQVVPSAITVAEGDAPSVLAEQAMTEELGLALAAEAKTAKANSTCLAANRNAIYTFENVAIGGSGNYLTWELGTAHFETANTADSNKPVSGKNYDLKAIAYGTYTGNNVDYLTMVVIQATEHTGGDTPVDPGEDVISIANLAKESATVKGVVVAKNTKSFLISDGTAGVMVYLNAAPTYEIGDYVKVSGTPITSKYSNGLLQFDSAATIEKLTDSTMPNIPAAVDLTAEKLAAWKAALPSDTTAQAEKFLELTEVVEYKWNATAAMSGNYLTLNLEGSDVVVEPVYLDTTAFPYTAGKEYSVKGYFVGYNYHDYAAVVITELTEVGGGDTPVDPTPSTNYGTLENPLSASEALTMATALGSDAYTAEKCYVTGVVTAAGSYNSQYNNYTNVKIADLNDSSVEFTIYRLNPPAEGEAHFVGDTITAYGYLQNYKGNSPQMSYQGEENPDLVAVTRGTSAISVNASNATVTGLPSSATNLAEVSFSVTVDSGYVLDSVKVYGNALTAENDGSYKFTVRGPATVEVLTHQEGAAAAVTAETTIAAYANANSWANGTQYTSLSLDDVATATVSGGGNSGKYYSSDSTWRLYQGESAKITIAVTSGYTIQSVTITYIVANNGTLVDVTSGVPVTVNASSVTYSVGNTGSATNGQAKITAISVTYVAA